MCILPETCHVYVLLSASGTNTSVPNENFGSIRINFLDGTFSSVNLIEGFNIREWVLNDSSNYRETTSSNITNVFIGITEPGSGSQTAIDQLKIPITLEDYNKTVSSIKFEDAIEHAGIVIYGATIEYSDTIYLPPSQKIVFIPGLGGSWNQDALLFDKEVEQSDWEMMPVYTDSYKAFFKTLTNAGLEKNRDFFGFYYDWRKPVEQNGQTFSNYLTTNFPDQEVDVVSHSMGGLVARSCLENIDGCKDKINKFITVGTPHKGAVDAYFLWHGVVTGSDPLAKSLESILLKLKGNNVAKIIPSVRDIMPIFDYISGKPYSQMSQSNKNPFLELLKSANTIPILTTISGNIPDSTSEKLKVISKKWGDGYPTKVLKGMGDDSVLTSSSQLGGASDYPFSFTHNNLLGANDPQIKILETLELPTDKLVENSVKDNQFRGIWFMYLPTTQNPAVTTMQTTSQTGFNVTCDSQVIQVDTNVFVAIDPTEGNCKVTVPPGNDGRFKVVVGDISDKNTNWKTVKGKGHKGLDRWYHVKYHKNHKCEIFDWLGNKFDTLE